MQKDAELHADEDKKKKEKIEAKNQADTLAYSTEKALKDYGDKVDAETKKAIEEKLEALKKLMAGEDAEAIKKATEELSQASMKLGEVMYKEAAEKQAAAGGAPAEGQGGHAHPDEKPKDGPVDAEYEPSDTEKK
jgi:molecular chaperone DnaK